MNSSSNEQKNSLNEQNILYYFSVRLGQFNGRALRLGQASGPGVRPHDHLNPCVELVF